MNSNAELRRPVDADVRIPEDPDSLRRKEVELMSNSNTQTFILVLTMLALGVGMYAELGNLRNDLRDDMNAQFGELRSNVNAQFGELNSDINAQFGELNSDINTQFKGLSDRMDSFFLILESRENISGLEARGKNLEAGVDEPKTQE